MNAEPAPRANPIKELAGSPVILSKDFAKLESVDYEKEEVMTLNMPTTSNVLQYFTRDGSKVSIRPSGTEPKVKLYVNSVSDSAAQTASDLTAMSDAAVALLNSLI